MHRRLLYGRLYINALVRKDIRLVRKDIRGRLLKSRRRMGRGL